MTAQMHSSSAQCNGLELLSWLVLHWEVAMPFFLCARTLAQTRQPWQPVELHSLGRAVAGWTPSSTSYPAESRRSLMSPMRMPSSVLMTTSGEQVFALVSCRLATSHSSCMVPRLGFCPRSNAYAHSLLLLQPCLNNDLRVSLTAHEQSTILHHASQVKPTSW